MVFMRHLQPCMASWDCCSSLGCSQQHLLNPTVFILITHIHTVRYTDMSWATLQLIGCCPAVTCMQHIHLATRFRTTGHYILSSARLHTSIKLLLCVLCLWHLGFAYCIRLLDMFVWLNATLYSCLHWEVATLMDLVNGFHAHHIKWPCQEPHDLWLLKQHNKTL